MEKSQFIALVEELTSARVIDRTDDVPLFSGVRYATIPHDGITLHGARGVVGGVLSASGTENEYRPVLAQLSSWVHAGDHVYLDGFQCVRPVDVFGVRLAFFITLPSE